MPPRTRHDYARFFVACRRYAAVVAAVPAAMLFGFAGDTPATTTDVLRQCSSRFGFYSRNIGAVDRVTDGDIGAEVGCIDRLTGF